MEEIAQVYSRALFEVAQEQGKLDEVRDQLGEFADAVDEHRSLQVFFFSPYFSSEEKKEGLRKAVEGVGDTVLHTLELLIDKHRMPALFRIRRQYDQLWAEENRLLPVELTSAIELDESTVKHVGEAIGQQTDRRIDLKAKVDPDILGGIVLRVGNSILDASIRSRLDQLRKQVARAA
jgi:F-type H+-transporting ATPase subunit delta